MTRSPSHDLPEPYWTFEERGLLNHHLMVCLRRLVPDPAIEFLVFVKPERNFLTHSDPEMAACMRSVHGNWSIWLRETLCGAPLPYRWYVEQSIEAVAHLIPSSQFLDEAIQAAR